MELSLWLRKRLSKISPPIWAGQMMAAVPYDFRPGLGRSYRQHKAAIRYFEESGTSQKKEWIFKRVKAMAVYAEAKIPFYKELYHQQGFDPACLACYADLQRIPIINKALLLSYALDRRSNLKQPGYLVNTGGTSGSTLDLYVHPDHLGDEWSHMHHIWGTLGFVPHDLKLMLTGRSEFEAGLFYDFLRHSLSISVYVEIDQIAPRLKRIIERFQPKYIHGYPSALYEFALACRERHPQLLGLLRNSLQGGFLGSEYPVKHFRETIEEVFQIPTVSWYGHTERCILAYEKEQPYIYHPFQTYGYTEVAAGPSGAKTLIGTSYYNRTSPLIRYDTEDQIADHERKDGLLAWFRIKEGRKGEFILDRNGKKIPLTGLIFGRHHQLFNYCSHIQIYQKKPGYATVLYVPLEGKGVADPAALFDSKHVQIEFDYQPLPEPLRTPAGKVKLVVQEINLQH